MGLEELFENNRKWADNVRAEDPHFFESLVHQQAPRYLWIGCSDSRVPANEIIGLKPGEVFVHRNVANLVMHTDFNCLSVVQYAVEVLHVEDILITGHYGCGGVQAALVQRDMGLIDNWLHSVSVLAKKHRAFLEAAPSVTDQLDRLCELNVIEQVRILCENALIRHAWLRGQRLSVHGCIYGLRDGRLHDLGATISSLDEIEPHSERALHALIERFE
ncbi:MAG: carbonate dehydratase [Terrimicrobiaceae bacterium]|nr:carbonate dehydratase [Terrimicrobiaceae bacterium]